MPHEAIPSRLYRILLSDWHQVLLMKSTLSKNIR